MWSFCEFLNLEGELVDCLGTSKSILLLSADPPLMPIATPSICAEIKHVYNLTADYQKTICYVSQAQTYTDARITCNNNGMQLYGIVDAKESVSKTSLLSYANKKWLPKSGNVFNIKGRKDSNCANINNTLGDFVDGFGSCSIPKMTFCQFISNARKLDQTLKMVFSSKSLQLPRNHWRQSFHQLSVQLSRMSTVTRTSTSSRFVLLFILKTTKILEWVVF
jgi:hypothetical protein